MCRIGECQIYIAMASVQGPGEGEGGKGGRGCNRYAGCRISSYHLIFIKTGGHFRLHFLLVALNIGIHPPYL